MCPTGFYKHCPPAGGPARVPRMTRVEGVLLDLANAQTGTNAMLATLAERHVELAQRHKALYEAQRVTEHNVNALISAVERHIASHS